VVPRNGFVGGWLLDGNPLDTSGNLNHGMPGGGPMATSGASVGADAR
jgi:hypothetical protein